MESSETLRFRALAHSIEQGNCVLVLGSGASTDSNESQEVPLTVKLARELAAELRDSSNLPSDLDCDDLRHVSQVLYEVEPNSTLLQVRVAEFYQGFSGNTTDLHRNIAALPFRLCITTTPDDFLFNALVEARKSPARHFYNFQRQRMIDWPEPARDRPLVYHLYGHPSDPESLVIKENDLIDFLVNVVRKEPALPAEVTNTLARSTCLFMDLGFKNWYLRVLLQSLGLRGHGKVSLALEEPEFFNQSKQHQTTVYFSASKTIQFRPDSLSEFVRKLRAVYESMAGSNPQPASQPPPGAPVVFLSYASEDRELVDRLASKLKSGGLAIWQDKQNLRAGDNWEGILTHVIQNRANYVVVVQTPTMMSREKGYFYREIKEALAYEEMLRHGLRFVFPVRTGSVRDLPELAHLHSVSIETDEGVAALVCSILEDWKVRESAGRAVAAVAS